MNAVEPERLVPHLLMTMLKKRPVHALTSRRTEHCCSCLLSANPRTEQGGPDVTHL